MSVTGLPPSGAPTAVSAGGTLPPTTSAPANFNAAPMQEHSFTANPGDTIWGQVRQQMDGAGLLRGKSPQERDRLIGEMVRNLKVYDENGREIPDKNLILKGKKYRIAFPGAAPAQQQQGQQGQQGQTPAQGDQFRPNQQAPVAGIGGGLIQRQPTGRSDQVARSIAQEAASWDYDEALGTQGRTMRQALDNSGNFDRTELGVCTDMALRAAKLFQEQGIDARVVGGKSTDYLGNERNHAWVEYMAEDGSWRKFDPTLAASNQNPELALTPENDGLMYYGQWFEVMDDQNMNGRWTPSVG